MNLNPDFTGADRIAAERKRQVDKEGYDSSHDDEHIDGELAMAASCYAATERIYTKREVGNEDVWFENPWPWDDFDDKRRTMYTNKERIRILEKSGALIAAEIDRLLRLEKK